MNALNSLDLADSGKNSCSCLESRTDRHVGQIYIAMTLQKLTSMMRHLYQSEPHVSTADLEAQVTTRAEKGVLEEHIGKKKIRSDGAYLDGLRGIAMLGVFNHHLLGNGQSAEENAATASSGFTGFVHAIWTRIFYMGGTPAVCFFFILTGYVLSISPLSALAKNRRKRCRAKLLVGALRRPLRLYLPVLTIGFIAALLMQLPYNIFPDAFWHERRDNILLELRAFVQLTWEFFQPMRDLTNGDHYGYDPVLWTIPITLKGSLLVYAVLMLFTMVPLSKHYMTGALWGAAIMLLHKAHWWVACFLAGVAIAVLRSSIGGPAIPFKRPQPWLLTVAGYVTVMASLYLLSSPSYPDHPELSAKISGWSFLISQIPSAYLDSNYYRFWHSYGAFGLILGLQHTPAIQRLLTMAPTQYLGSVSFMFYAIHMPFFLCVGDRWRRMLGMIPYMADDTWYDNLLRIPEWGSESLTLQAFVVYVSILGMTLVVAQWATKYIDEPYARLCKGIGRGLEERGSLLQEGDTL